MYYLFDHLHRFLSQKGLHHVSEPDSDPTRAQNPGGPLTLVMSSETILTGSTKHIIHNDPLYFDFKIVNI
jgi:hypothetical protein